MKTKRFFLIIVISILLAVNTSVVAFANGEGPPPEPPIPSPECGTYTDTRSHTGTFGNYSAYWFEYDISVIITSYNGWSIVQAKWLDENKDVVASYSFPPGTTSEIVPYHPFGGYLSVTLKKNCVCRPTGRYVYTLLGNYPCNLITKEKSIPARFLDPAYTGPLCNLPTIDHIWNGDWVKNEELNCGGYFVGGNHYDTSLGNLP